MSSLLVTVGADIAELRARMTEGEGLVHKFTEQVNEMAVGLAGAFALERVAEFAFEVSELAAKAAGVKVAFNEISQSTALLADMRETVHGTVDDLTLMGDAVRAEHLGIPLQDLGSILEFVHQRALTTGGSFQQMSDTLLRAIGKGGRGMIGAMEELQITTARYKEAFKETGDVAEAVMKLIEEEEGKTKGAMDKTLLAIEDNSAAWANLKLAIGEVLNKSELLGGAMNSATGAMKIVGSENLTAWEKFTAFMGGPFSLSQAAILAVANEHLKIEKELNKIWTDGIDIVAKRIQPLNTELGLQGEIASLKTEELTLTGKELIENQKLTAEYERQLKVLQNQYKTVVDAAKEAEKIQKRADLINLQNTIGPDTKQSDLEHMAATKLVANSENGGMQDFLTGEMDTAGPDHNKVLENYFKKMHESIKDINKEMSNMGKLADVAANSLVGAFKSVIDGSQNAAQALGHFVEEFGLQMLSMALMGIIGTAMNPGSNGGNYYVALALAGAGIAAVGALFASAGVKGGTPISGANGGGPNGYGNDPNSFYAQQQGMINSNLGNRVFEFKFQPIGGTQLQAVLVNQQRIDNQVKGG